MNEWLQGKLFSKLKELNSVISKLKDETVREVALTHLDSAKNGAKDALKYLERWCLLDWALGDLGLLLSAMGYIQALLRRDYEAADQENISKAMDLIDEVMGIAPDAIAEQIAIYCDCRKIPGGGKD